MKVFKSALHRSSWNFKNHFFKTIILSAKALCILEAYIKNCVVWKHHLHWETKNEYWKPWNTFGNITFVWKHMKKWFQYTIKCFKYKTYISNLQVRFPNAFLCFKYPIHLSKCKWCSQTTMFPMYVSNIHRAGRGPLSNLTFSYSNIQSRRENPNHNLCLQNSYKNNPFANKLF